MQVLFDGEVHVHYGFLAFEPEGSLTAGYLLEARGGQANGLCGAAVPGCLSMVTGLHTGDVPVRVEAHDEAPVLGADWQDVVEASFEVLDGDYAVTAFEDVHPVVKPPPGRYRARWSAVGMDAGREMDTRGEGQSAPDRYLLQLWPAPWQPDAVVRQASATAAYWHEAAAETPPYEPSEELEDLDVLGSHHPMTPEDERADRDEDELEDWGGRLPSDEVRAWDWPAVQLGRSDRPLVDEIVDLPERQQRALATWAATTASERAGVRDHPWVVEALEHVEQGLPLPERWQDWSAIWAAFDRHAADTSERLAVLVVGGGAEPLPPLDPRAAAISTVQAAGHSDAAQAAAGAAECLSSGATDRRACFAEVREAMRGLR